MYFFFVTNVQAIWVSLWLKYSIQTNGLAYFEESVSDVEDYDIDYWYIKLTEKITRSRCYKTFYIGQNKLDCAPLCNICSLAYYFVLRIGAF
jgi:hypothetical protein